MLEATVQCPCVRTFTKGAEALEDAGQAAIVVIASCEPGAGAGFEVRGRIDLGIAWVDVVQFQAVEREHPHESCTQALLCNGIRPKPGGGGRVEGRRLRVEAARSDRGEEPLNVVMETLQLRVVEAQQVVEAATARTSPVAVVGAR